MMFDLILKQLSSPTTGKMVTSKLKEMFSYLATEFKCEQKDVGLFLQLDNVPVKDKDGKETGATEELAMIYVYVKGQAVQKISAADFLALAAKGGK